MFKVGIGYDVHRFVEGRPLVLGGVVIPHSHGLDGHSDADVLIHAITDAIFGALGSGDIGVHFPNHDPQWKNARSILFLEKARDLLCQQHGAVTNVDATLIAETPKITPHIPAMRPILAAALSCDPRNITVKATTNEGMGFIGRGEGIAAMAVASLYLPD